MSPKKPNFELRVGVFVVVGLIVLMVMVFRMDSLSLFKTGYNLHIIFNYVSGISIGAPVDLAGVEAGEVKRMEIFYNKELEKTQVDVTARMRDGAIIRENSVARIKTLGLLGEKYIELTSGSIENKPLEEGGILFGQDPVSLEDMAESLDRAAKDLDKTIVSVNNIIGDYNIQNSLKESIFNFEQVSQRADSILSKIDEGHGTVGRLLTEDEIYNDLEDLAKDIKAHPWKLLYRPKEQKVTPENDRGNKKSQQKKSVF